MHSKEFEKEQDIDKVTVITVVYNAYNKIEETILSVVNQDFENVEYIIIDGGSNDGTLDIIKKYSEKISYWCSESDFGIYDAMNKGIQKSTGEWVNFMNAGDRFVSENVISSLFLNKKYEEFDVVFGNSIMERSNKIQVKQPVIKPIEDLWKGPVFRHGAMFTRLKLHNKYPFKVHENYKICADFDFIYRIYIEGCRMNFVNVDIIIFEEEGMSSNPIKNLQYNRMILLSYKHTFFQNTISFLRTYIYTIYIYLVNFKKAINFK